MSSELASLIEANTRIDGTFPTPIPGLHLSRYSSRTQPGHTTLQHLEQATGVNKSGLYSEFKDKEDLFLASLERYAQTRGAEILTAQPLGWGNIERFLRLGFGSDHD